MKVALIVNKIKANIDDNIIDILEYIKKAGEQEVQLIVFPEAAVTGLNLTDNPEEDIKLGLELKSQEIKQICNAARNTNLNIAIGILEKTKGKLYDSLLFINSKGEISLSYRRMSKGWRDVKQDTIYCEGDEVKYIDTEYGRISFLICGDLYNEKLIEDIKNTNPDYFVFPFARSYIEGININEAWKKEFHSEYIEQFKKTNAITLAVNYIDKYCFGGAYVVDRSGEVKSFLEIGQPGMLIVEV